jgi:hypothetical protein
MRGYDPDGVAETEADHVMKCAACREWFDMSDPGQVLAHVRAEIETGEGSGPPTSRDIEEHKRLALKLPES